MAAVLSPTDWMDFADWDRYWSEVLDSEFWTKANMKTWSFERTSLSHLESLERREGHRVLLAGNGISPEPFGFAHAGCDVTVIEVSKVACRFLASLALTPGLLAPMFPVYDKTVTPQGWTQLDLNVEKSCVRLEAEKRPGGTISIVNADLFDYEPEQPFQAIFSRRAYQGLPPDRRQALAGLFHGWLHPGGTAFVEMLNIRERKPLENPFRAVGFREIRKWSLARDGEKQVIFWHGSG
jgi:hypothetical protein